MRMSFLLLEFIFFFQLISLSVYGQKKITYGKVSMEELEMKAYEKDSSAGAVILSDIGRLNGNDLWFTRHIRIKILKKSGLEWGNWIINTPTKSEFNVSVFNLVDGQIVKEKLENNSIYREEIIKGFEVYKIFAPNVRVGSVIDIAYSFTGIPFQWRFQERIPTVYSELVFEDTNYLKFSKTHFGFEPIQHIPPYKWIAKDMPAFLIEPYINNYSNYISKFEFQITVIKVRKELIEYNTSWKNVIDILLEHSRFGSILKESPFLNNYAKEIKDKDLSTEEKISEALKVVQKNLKWNGQKSVFPTAGMRNNFLIDHSGNSAEVNLALISLLNKIGIATYPIVLSTRDNGLLVEYSPSLDKLNYVVGLVRHENVEMLVDATSEHMVPGILPEYCLNGRGLLVKKDNEQWYSLNNRNHGDIKRQFININIDGGGTVTAKINQDFSGYGFLNWVSEQKGVDHYEDIRKNAFQKDNQGIKVLSYEVSKKDEKSISGKETIEIDMSNNLIDAGDEMILNPFVLFDYSGNPFKSVDRKYPVDLTYSKELNTTVVVQLPKEIAVKKLPESIKFGTPDGGATFTYLANASGSNLQFKALVKLNKHIFDEMEYKDLRQFFSEVAKIINTPVQLTRL